MSQNLDSQSQIYGLTQHIEAILFWRG
ncbi:MAG: hypothetical protein RIQ72_571, partial [Candidatus Parcubacteria bacterium]